jgi:hypothetical protein
VITDESRRYVLTQLNPSTLWHYDRRWRRVSAYQPHAEDAFTTLEGRHHFAVVHQPEAGGKIEVTLRSANAPTTVLATGRFVDSWVFEGEAKLWGLVPEYLVTREKDGRNGLLRIEDDAEIDALEGFTSVNTIIGVPDSRLVIVGSPGSYTVYDPIAVRSIRHYQLAGGNQSPSMQFRNNEELWLNDIDTMLKIETKQFEVIDAAGSELDEGVEADTVVGRPGGFGRWNFAAEKELCVVTRPNVGDVLVLDAVSMLPVARGVFKHGQPMEALLIGRNTVIATDANGEVLRTRLRRVTTHFEGSEGPPAS